MKPINKLSDYTQAGRIIKKAGGASNLTRMINAAFPDSKKGKIARSSIYRWNWPRSLGGSDGIVPTRNFGTIGKAFRLHGLVLTEQDCNPLEIAPPTRKDGSQ